MEEPKEQLVMLVPHYGAPFEDTYVFTTYEKAMDFWRFLENRECVEIRKMTFDIDSGGWVY
jgi:hypothetical protein